MTERSTADLLADLNTLRLANGKTELKSWKASRADLELRIQQEQPAPTTPTPTPAPVAADIAKALDIAVGNDVPVTTVPASAPELTQPAKRKAVIKKMVDKAIETDTPTTVIDVKAAARKVKKADKGTKPAKAPKTSIPQGKGDFAKYLESIDMEGRVARAKLRRAKIAKNADGRYDLTDEVKAALASDGRKKDK